MVVHGKKSTPRRVVSGVPQGTVLGPLLFILLMGDIDEEVKDSVVSSFADDTNISRPISTVEDVDSLQRDLKTIYSWANKNNMTFNDDKFELLRSGKNTDIINNTSLRTSKHKEINKSSDVKCLGVYLSENGTFPSTISIRQ